jgi:hypothetical protein
MKKATILFGALFSTIISLNAQATIDFKVKEYDFGYVKEGDKAEYSFDFENNGNDTLFLKNVQAQCGCTTPNWSKEGITDGESDKIFVSFNSSGRVGAFYKIVSVYTNIQADPEVLVIKGYVVPQSLLPNDSVAKIQKDGKAALVFEKQELNFGKTQVGVYSTKEVKVTNTSKYPVRFFSNGSGCGCVNTDNDLTVQAGESKLINIQFSPRNLGLSQEKLVISTDDVDHPIYEFKIKSEAVPSLIEPENMLLENQQSRSGF